MAVGFVLITTEPGEEVNVRNSLDSVEGVVGRWVVFGSHDLLSLIHISEPTRP